jgi:hypothetical protein
LVGADETVTDAEGRFALPCRFFAPALVTHVPEPELGLFKAGYGGWRFRDRSASLTDRDTVVEMRPLPTPAERRQYLEGAWTRAEHDRMTRIPPPKELAFPVSSIERESRGYGRGWPPPTSISSS